MLRTLITGIIALAFAGAGSLIAQEATDQPTRSQPAKKADRATKLQRALRSNAQLASVGFSTVHRKLNDASLALFKVQGANQASRRGRRVRTAGTWSGALLSQSFGDEERVIFHGRRMIAMDEDIDWVCRRGHRADGEPLGFVFDPRTLFSILGQAEFQVIHNEVGSINDKPVATYTITLTGDDANTLLWSGAIPNGKGSTPKAGRGGNMVRVFAAGGFGGKVTTGVTVELAISFDPATQRIHRVRGRSMSQGAAGGLGAIGGRILINGAGGGQGAVGGRILINGAGVVADQEDQEDEDVETEADRPEAGTFKNGLPVHSKKELRKWTVVEFTFDFKDHGQAKIDGLDARARRLLGLPTSK